MRLAEGAQILDEYRVVGDEGRDVLRVVHHTRLQRRPRSVGARSAEQGAGLQNFGTARRVGAEMHIEQKFGVDEPRSPRSWRIRYYDIRPDRFSWTADRSDDGGKTWEKDHLTIEARRIGPSRSLGPLAPATKPK